MCMQQRYLTRIQAHPCLTKQNLSNVSMMISRLATFVLHCVTLPLCNQYICWYLMWFNDLIVHWPYIHTCKRHDNIKTEQIAPHGFRTSRLNSNNGTTTTIDKFMSVIHCCNLIINAILSPVASLGDGRLSPWRFWGVYRPALEAECGDILHSLRVWRLIVKSGQVLLLCSWQWSLLTSFGKQFLTC